MSKFFEFVGANLRLAANLMISPSERFHAGLMTANVADLAFEGLRGVTSSIDATSQFISQKAHKARKAHKKSPSLWATLCDTIAFNESFAYLSAPSERTCVAGQMLSSRSEPQATPHLERSTKPRSLWTNLGLMTAPSELNCSAGALMMGSAQQAAAPAALKTQAKSERTPRQPAAAQGQQGATTSAGRTAGMLTNLWGKAGLVVGPNALNSAAAMSAYVDTTMFDRIRAESAAPAPAAAPAAASAAPGAASEQVAHPSLFSVLAETSAYAEERSERPQSAAAPIRERGSVAALLAQAFMSPTERLVQYQLEAARHAPAAQAATAAAVASERSEVATAQELSFAQKVWLSMVPPTERMVRARLGDSTSAPVLMAERSPKLKLADLRLADLLAQASLTPTQRLVDYQVAGGAPEVAAAAQNLSSYAVATLTEQPAMSDAELTTAYLKHFEWLDQTQALLMAHVAQALHESEQNAAQEQADEATQTYVTARWDGIVAALTDDTPQAIAALPYKAPKAPLRGVLATVKRITASESKIQAAQVIAGRRLAHLN